MRLEDGFTGPVGYPAWVLAVALVPPLLVAAWCAAVVWWTRERQRTTATPAPDDVRREALARLDDVERAVASGDMSPRHGHQEIARICRTCLDDLGVDGARSMTLLRARLGGPAPMAEVLDLVYPPEFEPGSQGSPEARLQPALRGARTMVATWEA